MPTQNTISQQQAVMNQPQPIMSTSAATAGIMMSDGGTASTGGLMTTVGNTLAYQQPVLIEKPPVSYA